MKSNKLIANYMGIKSYEASGYTNFVYSEDNHRTEVDLSYHDSWDWLMPVVEKIEEQHGCDFTASRRRATRTYDANFMDEVNNYVVYVEGCKDRKEATYKAVVEFINQYNKIK